MYLLSIAKQNIFSDTVWDEEFREAVYTKAKKYARPSFSEYNELIITDMIALFNTYIEFFISLDTNRVRLHRKGQPFVASDCLKFLALWR